MDKKFKIQPADLKQLIPPMGGCIATDYIIVEGMQVHYMYRAEPQNEQDSGWQFFAGLERKAYLADIEHVGVYAVNTLANYDPAIIPYLSQPIGSFLEREEGTDTFHLVG